MADHKAALASFNVGMSDRADNHQTQYNAGDSVVSPHTPDQLRFSQNDGDAGNLRLANKSISPADQSVMPIIGDAYRNKAKRNT